eukprot:COSAG05_NODE_378_length_10601_cov_10.955437_6_plen_140_part_00
MHCARMFDSSLRADAGICPLPNRVHTYVFAETVTSEGDLVDVVRGYGVRRENVRMNTGVDRFAFKSIQIKVHESQLPGPCAPCSTNSLFSCLIATSLLRFLMAHVRPCGGGATAVLTGGVQAAARRVPESRREADDVGH